MRRHVVIAGLCLGLVSAGQAQDNFANVKVKIQKVSGTVYMLEGAGGNIGASIGDDGIVIIDDQFAPLAPKIEAALKSVSDKPLKCVLNTHWHGDHTGSNEIFGQSAWIIAQTHVRERLAAGVDRPDRKIAAAPAAALPILTFDDSVVIHLNGEDIRAMHYPNGHTDGDSVIYFSKSNVVHMGDDFSNKRFPFIDLQSGGSVKGMIKAVEKVVAELPADVKIIPGHGPLATRDDLKAFLEMLKDTSNIVQSGMAKGKTLEQLKQENVLAKYDAWSWEFISADRFLELLYNDLSRRGQL